MNRPFFALFLLLAGFLHATENASSTTLLTEAEALLGQITTDNTTYTHKTPVVRWKTENAAALCHTDCSGFLMALLTNENPAWNAEAFKRHFGAARPTARRFHDAILAGKVFQPVTTITDIRPGDVIAIKYPAGGESTGHVMIVAETPKKAEPTKPILPGTEQWLVTILDVSQSGHGPTDTRHNPDKTFRQGLGKGVFRLYLGPDRLPRGYSWSTVPASAFKNAETHRIAIGRLPPAFQP